jgi:serine/threonine protein kinase/Tfp pilus assembly protein PilF
MTGEIIGQFRILRKIGEGGMGVVHLAEDSRLKRCVAIKSLSPKSSDDPQAQKRLLREARSAARLNHPNIAAVHDVLEIDGRVHIIMEYLDGETLFERLRHGHLSVQDAISISIDLCNAIAEAHRCGIVHRDLKPANVFVTKDGSIKIVDFGLSKAVAPPQGSSPSNPPSTDSFSTEIGVLVGTPAYMAPEQLTNQPVDARLDIYSLGVVMFQMLAGRTPFQGDDFVKLAMAILTSQAPELTTINPAVPLPLSQAVARAMSREPRERFQTADELKTALFQVQQPQSSHPSSNVSASNDVKPAGITVAVLPLINVTGDATIDYVAVGMADFLISRLDSLPGATVISRYATQDYRNAQRNLDHIAKELNATVLVDGSFQRVSEQLRITLSIINARTRAVEWSRSFDSAIAQFFATQHEIGEAVSDALWKRLGTAGEKTTARLPTTNADAFAEYAQGRALWERSDVPGNLERAEELFQSAIQKDRRFALAHTGLGQVHWARYKLTKDSLWASKALTSLMEAMRLDPREFAVRRALADVYRGTGQNEGAIEELRQLLAIQPADEEAHRSLGEILAETGRTDEAIEHLKTAIQLRPMFARNHRGLGLIYLRIARYDEAVESLKKAIDLQPDFGWAYQMLGTVYHKQGKILDALDNYRRAIELSPNGSAHTNIGNIYYAQGDYSSALIEFQQAAALTPNNPIYQRNIGDTLLRLGQIDAARDSFRRAVALSRELLNINPNDVATLSRLAVYEAKLGQTDTALTDAERSVELNPNDIDVLYRKGVVHALLGQFPQAIDWLRRSLAHGWSVSAVLQDDDLAGLRELPEFQTLIHQHNNSLSAGG